MKGDDHEMEVVTRIIINQNFFVNRMRTGVMLSVLAQAHSALEVFTNKVRRLSFSLFFLFYFEVYYYYD
jgi:hypothetical protein